MKHLAVVPPAPDFWLRRQGSRYVLLPLSAAAHEFIDLNSTYGFPHDTIDPCWIEEALSCVADSGLIVAGVL